MDRVARNRRNGCLHATLAVCATVVLTGLVAVAPAGAARRATVSGTLTRMHFDGLARPAPAFWAVTTRTRVVRLALRGAPSPWALQGRRVRARGRALTGDLLALGRSGLTVLRGRSPLGRSAAARRTAVVLIHFPDPPDSQAAPVYTPAAVRPQIFGDAATDPYSVAEYYRTQTYGQVQLQGDIFGSYAVSDANPGCHFGQWSSNAATQAAADGFDANNYQSVIYLFATGRCVFAGVGQQPGSQVWINNLNRYTIEHELGHTFGNPHASSLRCHGAGGAVVTLSTSCDPYDEYGDPFDPMGSGGTAVASVGYQAVGHEMEPWRKLRIGSITTADTPTVNTPGTYHLAPLEHSTGVRMLRLLDGRGDNRMFDLSFRQPLGTFDATYLEPNTGNPNAVNGVLVNWDSTAPGGDNSLLLDTTPNTIGGTEDPFTHQITTGFEDAPLAAGRSFSDPQTGLTLTVNSVGAGGAQVTLAYGRGAVDIATPTAPGAPHAKQTGPAVKLTWAAASDGFGVTRYLLSRDGKDLQGPTSTSATDRPAPGTHTYAVRAADAVGNVGPSATAKVNVFGCRVPKLKGKSLAAARRALKKAHCAVGKVSKRRSRKVKAGRVIGQGLKVGRRRSASAKVKIVVSAGPDGPHSDQRRRLTLESPTRP